MHAKGTVATKLIAWQHQEQKPAQHVGARAHWRLRCTSAKQIPGAHMTNTSRHASTQMNTQQYGIHTASCMHSYSRPQPAINCQALQPASTGKHPPAVTRQHCIACSAEQSRMPELAIRKCLTYSVWHTLALMAMCWLLHSKILQPKMAPRPTNHQHNNTAAACMRRWACTADRALAGRLSKLFQAY